jgi:hypothetical protein
MDDLMQHKHIPEVLATGKFTTARLVGINWRRNGWCYLFDTVHKDSKETLEKYYQEDAPRFREEGSKLFGEKCLRLERSWSDFWIPNLVINIQL